MKHELEIRTSKRSCGGCTLCCKLLPIVNGADDTLWDMVPEMIGAGLMTPRQARETIRDFNKPSGQRCPHQRSGKGCAVYDRRPLACRFWSCGWISEMPGTEKMSRPDRTHYVINPMPDFVDGEDERGQYKIPVIEVWVDKNYRDAWREDELLALIAKLGEERGWAALIRYASDEAFLLVPPSMTADKQWMEKRSSLRAGAAHTYEEKLAAISNMSVTMRVGAEK